MLNLIFFLILILFSSVSTAATYYIDQDAGSDAANGTSEGTAWKTLGTLSGRGFSPGDQILLQRGDVWKESLPIPSSGASGNPITYGAYGTGAKPEITGGEILTGWTTHATYGWQATSTASIGHLFINGVRQAKARWPDTGVNTITTTPPNCTQLTSTSITQPNGYWTGATVWVEDANWNMDSATITNHIGNTIYWSGDLQWCRQSAGDDFYIEWKQEELDANGEWFKSGNTVYFMWPTDPDGNTVVGTSGGTAINVSNKDYITIQDIKISYLNSDSVNLTNASDNWTFDDVEFIGIDGTAIYTDAGGTTNLSVKNSAFSRVLADGIRIRGGDSATITNNSFSDMCGDPDKNLRNANPIFFRTSNTAIFDNTIERVCYNGIWVGESLSNVTIENNEISDYMRAMDDGGAIYFSFGGTNVSARRNYIHDASANTGTRVGLYPDMNVTGTTFENNLVVNAGDYGILCNRCRNNIFRYNTIVNTLDTGTGINMRLAAQDTGQTENNQIYGNIFYNSSQSSTALSIEDVQPSTSTRGFSVLDYNLYYMPSEPQPICFKQSGFSCEESTNIERHSVASLIASPWNFENNGVQSNPDFLNLGDDLYGLTDGSAAIDQGDGAAYPTTDIDGISRPQGSAPDIGACEGSTGTALCGAQVEVVSGWNGPYAGPYFVEQKEYPADSDRYAQYEYEAQIIVPTPLHGISCATSTSQQSPVASDEFFVTMNGAGPTDKWAQIHDSTTHGWTKVFICDADYSSVGTINIKRGGIDTDEDHKPDPGWLKFVHWSSDPPSVDDGGNPRKWNDPASPGAGPERAILPPLKLFDVSAIVFQGTTHVSNALGTPPIQLDAGVTSGADDILFDRTYINPTLKSASNKASGLQAGAINEYLTVQNTAVTGCGYTADTNYIGVSVKEVDFARIVNSEIWDCTDNISGECVNCIINGLKVENNDIYFTSNSYTSLAGAAGADESPAAGSPTTSGDYMCRENGIDLAGASPTAGNQIQIVGNRFSGSKPGFAGTGCTCGQVGDYKNQVIQLSDNFQNGYIGGNVFYDLEAPAIALSAGAGLGVSHVSINGNLIHGVTNSDGRAAGSAGTCGAAATPVSISGIEFVSIQSSNEARFNTIVDVAVGTSPSGLAYGIFQTDTSDIDFECNTFINSADWGTSDPTTGYINDNFFVGMTKKYVSPEADDNYVATLATWAASTGYTAGGYVRPTSGTCTDGTEAACFLFVAESTGTSAASEPNPWPTTLGSMVIDNNIVWRAVLGPQCLAVKGHTGPQTKCLGNIVPYPQKTDWDVCDQLVGDRLGYGIDDQPIDLR